MHCRNVDRRIQELLDDRLNPACDSQLMEHASTCPECHALLEAHRSLVDGLLLNEVPNLPDDFSQRVVSLAISHRPTTARRFAPVAAVLAIVATLLLVTALGPQKRSSIGPADDARVVASVPMDVHSTRLSMADFDSEDVRIALKLIVASFAEAEGVRFYHVDQLAGTIRPLATTLNVAFDAIRRSIPSRRSQPTPVEPQASEIRTLWALHVV